MSKAQVRYDWEHRVRRARELMQDRDVDGLYVSAGANQFYFTGFSAYEGGWPVWLSAFVLPLDGEPTFILTDMHRDILDHAETWVDDVRTYMDGEDPTPILAEVLEEKGLADGTIGVEADMWYGDSEIIDAAAPDATITEVQGLFDRLRMVKDEAEIENIRTATEITAGAFEAATEAIREGRPEYEAAQEINQAMLEGGSEKMGLGGDFRDLRRREFEDGDIVDVDMGARYNHYATDCARNVFVGEPSDEHRRIYEVCGDCFHATLDMIEPGVTASEVHEFAQQYMNDAGYDQPWKIGHGVGLMAGHEAPMVQDGDETVLEPGMIFVVDPGTFVDGQEQDKPIHVESPVLVTETGAEDLLPFTYEVITV